MRPAALALLLALLAGLAVATAAMLTTHEDWLSASGGGSFLPPPDLWRLSQP